MNHPQAGLPPSSPAPAGPPGWKLLLALLCLVLSALLWISGLTSSLGRPSVQNDLELHQLELASLAADLVPPALAPALVGDNPRARLAEALSLQIGAADPPAPALRRLELALLERSGSKAESAPEASLRELIPMVEARRRPLLEALLRAERLEPGEQQSLLAAWQAPPLVAQLSCEQLGGPQSQCPAATHRSRWLGRLIAVNLLPALLLLIGALLLVRELWLLGRGRLPSPPPLLGPPLSLVDATLLIAGGFVLIGELLLPQLVQPGLQSVLRSWVASPALGQGLQVLLLYGAVTLTPLAILGRMLRAAPEPSPAGGWLQWGWLPPTTVLRQALLMVLLVMPLVALSSWLVELIWSDPGGSNPMLELLLNGSDPLTLACFAITALVLAPLFEETLFRGVLLPVLGRWLGSRRAVLLSAALFAAAHLSLGEFVPLFVLGIGLGVLRLRSGRLAASVLMHALWNGLTFVNLLLLGS